MSGALQGKSSGAKTRLAIDLQSCQTDSRDRGIGRYSLGLAAAIAARSDDLCTTLLLDGVDQDRLRDVRRRLRHEAVPARTATYSYPCAQQFTDYYPALADGAGLLKSRLVAGLEPDILLSTSFFEVGSLFAAGYDFDAIPGISKAVIAYDLIPALFPDRYLPKGHFVSDWYWKRLEQFRRFDLFLAISEATRRDMIEHLDIAPERIVVIGAGLDASVRKAAAAELTPLAERRLVNLRINLPFVLMVGNADWRKNSLGALEAFAALPEALRKAHQLVFTRVGDDVLEALDGRYAFLRESVVVAGSVDNETLSVLYKRCKLFFFPSYYEGFGLPVLEAMAMGAPALSSSLGALSEVVHDSRMLFDPRDPRASAAILRRGLEDQVFRQEILAGTKQHALSFDWDRCADLAISALKSLARSAPLVRTESSAWRPTSREIGRLAEALEAQAQGGEVALQGGLECIAAGTRRRILIDISEVVRLDARSGIQRVVRNYCVGLLELARQSGSFDAEPIRWTEWGIEYARTYVRDRLGAEVEGDDALVEVRPNDLLFMVDSSWWSPDRFDDLQGRVRRQGGEIVWMVYDLVPIQHSEYCDPNVLPVFKAWLEHVSRSSDGCICISESTRAELLDFFAMALPEDAYRPWTRALHLGADMESGRAQLPDTATEKFAGSLMGAPYFVALSTVEPRKDHETILGAFESLWAEGIRAALVIIGKQGWNVEAFAQRLRAHPCNGEQLFWLENASDGDVRHLLENATALIQASRAEGYGLAVAEAGSLGVPLVLSDLAVFREIAGNEADYFPVGDSEALARTLSKGLRAGSFCAPTNISCMTWRESSEKLVDALLSSPN